MKKTTAGARRAEAIAAGAVTTLRTSWMTRAITNAAGVPAVTAARALRGTTMTTTSETAAGATGVMAAAGATETTTAVRPGTTLRTSRQSASGDQVRC